MSQDGTVLYCTAQFVIEKKCCVFQAKLFIDGGK